MSPPQCKAGLPSSPNQRESFPQKLWSGALCIPFAPSFTAGAGDITSPFLSTTHHLLQDMRGDLAGGPGMSAWSLWDGQQLSSPTALQGVGCCGAWRGPAAACGVALCHGATLAQPRTGQWEQVWSLHGPGLQTLCWMIGISLKLQAPQPQRGSPPPRSLRYLE